MEFSVNIKTNLKTGEAKARIIKAARAALKDIVIDTTQDAKENSPVSGMWPSIDKSGRVPTGNNARSINFEMGPGGDTNLTEDQGAVFSTSGYGGYLETGTSKMPPRPYIKPAVDKNFTPEKYEKQLKEHLGEE